MSNAILTSSKYPYLVELKGVKSSMETYLRTNMVIYENK